ncbi:hypothetical protein IVB18_50410 (plasmid) [Bradyrhizobium sp. 186]|uniref:hypothetical protein n=1 Tax=Bradyrhizobium sp. 186 TaxID=2782654 RepID=UPI002001A62E|nr:hypothetical protein [Bradyrhizobium sp. 186]UPK40839.1 hypothetical protein IVB18_50410 [Bradyrhizobium sp. 186]
MIDIESNVVLNFGIIESCLPTTRRPRRESVVSIRRTQGNRHGAHLGISARSEQA